MMICNVFVWVNMRPQDALPLSYSNKKHLLCTSPLLKQSRCWDLLKANSLPMGIRQIGMTNSDLPGSVCLDQAGVPQAGTLADQIR